MCVVWFTFYMVPKFLSVLRAQDKRKLKVFEVMLSQNGQGLKNAFNIQVSDNIPSRQNLAKKKKNNSFFLTTYSFTLYQT